jgi:prolyl-tRNA synthetase
MKQHISSYKTLPVYVYQIQTKFRNEERAKSGIMRGREFLMKDLYSFSRNQEDLDTFYEEAAQAYKNIFDRVGVGAMTFMTFASGGVFCKYSHEFQTLSDAGEDIIYVSHEKNIAINSEVYNDEVLADLGVKKEDLVQEKSIEVGNIFKLGTRFSDALGLNYVDEDGASTAVVMGSYGIGPGRLMGTIVETLADSKGIVWPSSVAPFAVHLISLSQDEETEKIYKQLTDAGIEVLFDDRDMGAGAKFADSDLMGIPVRVVVGKKSLEQGGVEVKKRTEEQGTIVSLEKLITILK